MTGRLCDFETNSARVEPLAAVTDRGVPLSQGHRLNSEVMYPHARTAAAEAVEFNVLLQAA
jgi:hypothetical protein